MPQGGAMAVDRSKREEGVTELVYVCVYVVNDVRAKDKALLPPLPGLPQSTGKRPGQRAKGGTRNKDIPRMAWCVCVMCVRRKHHDLTRKEGAPRHASVAKTKGNFISSILCPCLHNESKK
jgi:hypothetical protein